MIQKKIKNTLATILTFKLDNLITRIITQEQNDKMKEAKNSINKFQPSIFINVLNKYVKKLIGKPEEDPKEFKFFINLIDNFIPFNDKYKRINKILIKINDFEEFMEKKKIRIIFLGKISTGKTSLMNSIIGHNYNILPITQKENTNNIFIFRYASSFIKLSESILKENENGSFFEEKDTIIELDKSKIENKDEINKLREIIKKLNDENKFKYYTLYIPIEGLENIEKNKGNNDDFSKIEKIDIQNIELIDLPGIKESLLSFQKTGLNDGFKKIDLENLINLTDGFILSFNAINIKDNSSLKLLSNIIKFIKNRKDSFDFRNCLFNLNSIDQFKNEQIENVKNIFEKEIKKILNINLYNCNFIERLQMKENISSKQFNISYISNTTYALYKEKINEIESLDFIENENLESLDDIDSYLKDEFLNLINKNENEKDKDNKKEDQKKKIVDKLKQLMKVNNDEEEKIKKINEISNNIISILNNKEELQIYKESYASFFFNEFYKQINFAKKNNDILLKKKTSSFYFRLLYYLFYIDSLCLDINKINQLKIKINEKVLLIESKFKEYDNKVNSYLEDLLEKIKQIHTDINEKINKNGPKIINKIIATTSREEIKQLIKKEKVEDKIHELVDKFRIQLDLLKNEFLKYNLLIISDLLDNSEKFEKLFAGFLLKFQIESYYKKTSKKNTLAAALFVGGLIISFIPILEIFGAIISGVGELLFFYNPDSFKADDYFNDAIKSIKDYKNKYIKQLRNIKDQFIHELHYLENYSKEEIEYLKNRDFHSNFNHLIEIIDNSDYEFDCIYI